VAVSHAALEPGSQRRHLVLGASSRIVAGGNAERHRFLCKPLNILVSHSTFLGVVSPLIVEIRDMTFRIKSLICRQLFDALREQPAMGPLRATQVVTRSIQSDMSWRTEMTTGIMVARTRKGRAPHLTAALLMVASA
jgi:hypothetical protein